MGPHPTTAGRGTRTASPARRSRVLATAALALALSATACAAPTSTEGTPGSAAADLAASVAAQSPAPPPAPAPSLDPVPAPGTVTVAPGPFVDRVSLEGLALSGDQVTGTLDMVRDVSEVLALEVQVDAYDTSGALLGTQTWVADPASTEEHHTTEGVQDLPLAIAAPGAASAVLSIPVLVNE